MKDTENTSESGFTAISLFSGAGGMDVGVIRAGYRVILANDIDHDACETYKLNHGPVIVEGSILNLIPMLNRMEGVDLVFGGPPCQGFSVAGKMNPDDPRSALIRSFFDVVDTVRPKAFICENVKALAVLGKWEEIRKQLLERANKNYRAALIVLNASDFGVPQNRERMFIVGIRNDVYSKSRAEFSAEFSDAVGKLKKKPLTVADVVRSLGRAGSSSNARTCNAKITFAKAPVMRASPYAGMLFNGAGRPLPSDGVAATLAASMGGNKTPIVDEEAIFSGSPEFVVGYHQRLSNGSKSAKGEAPSRLRRLTVDECLAIQTFPADYKLSGSRSAMYRQIGNAVPCELAHAVTRALKQIIVGTHVVSEPSKKASMRKRA